MARQLRRLRTIITVSIAAGSGLAVFLIILLQKINNDNKPNDLVSALTEWAAIVVSFAVLLGAGGLVRTHLQKIKNVKAPGEKILSALMVISFLAVVVAYAFDRLQSGGTYSFSSPGSAIQFVFLYIYQPLNATYLSLIAFLIIGAATRTLRLKTVEATIILVIALITLVGLSPLTRQIPPLVYIANLSDWLLNYPVVAGVRGILIGVALGAITTSLRVLIGIDRQYLA